MLGAIAAVCCAATAIVFYPGFLSPDSVSQLSQALGERPLADWHPPVLSLVWRALIAVSGTAAAMAVLQSVVVWASLWLIAWCVWQYTADRLSSLAVLAIGLAPHVLTFVGVVWKDVHMAAALLAVTAVAVTARRLRPEQVTLRRVLFAIGLVCLVYAVLVRKNAVFAAVPLFVMLVLAVRRGTGRRVWVQASAAFVVALVVPILAISLFARPVETSQVSQIALDDLVHVLSADELRAADVSSELRDRLVAAAGECERINAVSDAYWRCYERAPDGLATDSEELNALWRRQMVEHVPGYLAYRLDLFSNLLFHTTYQYQDGILGNDLGMEVAHPRLEAKLQYYVTTVYRLVPPLFAGWFWLAVAVVLALRPGTGVFATPVRVLGISAALYIVGYLPIVPTTDYRYVYWPALAGTLGLMLLWADRRAGRA
ncbi:hypothetical protein [Streptomyces sp. NPDC057002]|uniref:hypothetical protein n=1 Tax=Streptomyces sp. NPDC057002 TaxID=3345992 RepID=UPI003637EA4B